MFRLQCGSFVKLGEIGIGGPIQDPLGRENPTFTEHTQVAYLFRFAQS